MGAITLAAAWQDSVRVVPQVVLFHSGLGWAKAEPVHAMKSGRVGPGGGALCLCCDWGRLGL